MAVETHTERYADPQGFAREMNLPLLGAARVRPIPAGAGISQMLEVSAGSESVGPIVDGLAGTRQSLTLRSLLIAGFPGDPECFAVGLTIGREWSRRGLRVAVVDLDFWNPTVARPRGHPNEGLVDVLEYGCSFGRVSWELVADRLWLIGPGSHPPSEGRMADHPDWPRASRVFGRHVDVTLYVAPLLDRRGFTGKLSKRMDAAILAASVTRMGRSELRDAFLELWSSDAPMIGCVGIEAAPPAAPSAPPPATPQVAMPPSRADASLEGALRRGAEAMWEDARPVERAAEPAVPRTPSPLPATPVKAAPTRETPAPAPASGPRSITTPARPILTPPQPIATTPRTTATIPRTTATTPPPPRRIPKSIPPAGPAPPPAEQELLAALEADVRRGLVEPRQGRGVRRAAIVVGTFVALAAAGWAASVFLRPAGLGPGSGAVEAPQPAGEEPVAPDPGVVPEGVVPEGGAAPGAPDAAPGDPSLANGSAPVDPVAGALRAKGTPATLDPIEERKPYRVHIASFRSEDKVGDIVASLKQKGLEAWYEPAPDLGGWYRVFVGRFATEAEARAYADRLLATKTVDRAQSYPPNER